MSTLDINSSVQKAQRVSFIYLLVSLFCALFGGVYEAFGHGVLSFHMVYAFAFPLLLGVLIFMIARKKANFKYPSPIAAGCYHMSIATATVGSVLQGVLDIYGTTNDLMFVYIIASIGLFIASCVLYATGSKKSK